MRKWFRKTLDSLRASYWFIPTVMTCGAVILAFLMIRLDQSLSLDTIRSLGFGYYNQPDGARSLVSTVASSMITVAGTTFSITLAVLSLTSGQFGPRLLSNFMRDLGNQIVLGTFVATYVYCLLVLRTIHTSSSAIAAFVPHLSVVLAIVLALLNVGVFIYFIHHTAESIQASTITARIAHELEGMIKRLYPEATPDDVAAPPTLTARELDPHTACAVALKQPQSGYLQNLDENGLLNYATEHNVTVQCLHIPGTFVFEDQPVALVWPKDALDDDGRDDISNYFTLGPRRTPAHDLDFLFDQLSEMALRALSPGVNDAVTAMRCADRIAAGFHLMVSRRPPASKRFDEGGGLRLILPQIDLGNLVEDTLGEFRRYSADNMLVSMHLLDIIGTLLVSSDNPDLRRALLSEAALIREGSKKVLLEADFARLDRRYEEAVNATGPVFLRPAR